MRTVEGSIASYVEHMKRQDRSPATVRVRVGVLTALARHAGRPLTELDRADLADWEASLAVSSSARANYVSYVRCFYRWALDYERVTVDPSRWLVTPHVARRRPRPIGEDDLARAVTAAGEPVRTWLILAGWAGLRGMEIAGLHRGDVYEAADPPVLVIRGKGAKERIVPTSPLVLATLRPYLRTSGPLWRRADSRPADAQTVRKPCNRHLHELGIDATLHKLRSRFATQLHARSEHNLLLTQRLLGHASPATTAVYVDWSDREAAVAVAALDTRSTA